MKASSVEVSTVSGRSLNELTMKHYTDGEKVTTKAGERKVVRKLTVNKDAKRTYSIYDVDYRRTLAKAIFKYRGKQKILQKFKKNPYCFQ